jgi:uroporphyrinogen-III synthase
VRHFVDRNVGLRAPVLAIGETTARAARELGFEVTVAPSPDLQGMAGAIHRWAEAQH